MGTILGRCEAEEEEEGRKECRSGWVGGGGRKSNNPIAMGGGILKYKYRYIYVCLYIYIYIYIYIFLS